MEVTDCSWRSACHVAACSTTRSCSGSASRKIIHRSLKTRTSTVASSIYLRSWEDARVGSLERKGNMAHVSPAIQAKKIKTIFSSTCSIYRMFRLGCTLPTRQTIGRFLPKMMPSHLTRTYSLTSAHPSPKLSKKITTYLSPMHTFITAVEMSKQQEGTSPASQVTIASSGSLSGSSNLQMYARSCTSTKYSTILPWATTNLNRQFCSAVTMMPSEFKKPSSSQSSLASSLRTLLRPSATRSRKNMCRCLNSTRVLVTSLLHSRSPALSTKDALLDIRCPSGSATSASTPLTRAQLSADPLTISSSSMSASPYGMIHAHHSEYTSMPRTTMRRPFQTRYSCHYTNG